MKNRRVTLDMIKQAYKNTGLVPLQGKWYKPGYACPISVLCIDEAGAEVFDDENDDEIDDNIQAIANRKFESMYVCGFIEGFDNDPCNSTEPSYSMGFADGRQIRKALFPDNGPMYE